MTKPKNVHIYPGNIEAGSRSFRDGTDYYGILFVDADGQNAATINFSPEALKNFASQLEILTALANTIGTAN